MLTLLVEGALLLACLGLSACFSGVESALFSLDKARIRELEKSKSRGARTIRELLVNPYATLITILIGNLLVNTAASALATTVALRLFGDAGLGLAIGAMTFILLITGEITPKTYAVNNPQRVALRLARPLQYFAQVMAPFLALLKWLNHSLLKALERRFPTAGSSITEEEIRTLIRVSEREGHLDSHERHWITNIFRFSDLEVKDIMRRADEAWLLDGDLPRAELEAAIRANQCSRVPVYQGERANIVGILAVKELLLNPDLELRECLRAPLVVRPRQRVDQLLKKFQQERQHLAVVKQDGEMLGLVTLEDLLEEIFGEIYDERDQLPVRGPR